MHQVSPSLLIAFDSAVFVATALLLGIFLKRRREMHTQACRSTQWVIFGGVAAAGITALLHAILVIRELLPESVIALIETADFLLPISLASAALLLIYGVGLLVYQAYPQFSSRLLELQRKQAELSDENSDLSEILEQSHRKLQISSDSLQQAQTEQQASRSALLRSEKKFRTLFDKSPALFATVDTLQRITDINLFGAKSLGFDTVSLVGQPLAMVVAAEDAYETQAFIDDCFGNPHQKREIEIRMMRENMTTMWVRIAGSIIQQQDEDDYLLLVCQDITESKRLAANLSYQAEHDELTGLYNRRALEAFLEAKILEQQRNSKPLALICIDVDQIKVVNDTCGHSGGDEYMRSLVKLINRQRRQFDFFARIGGDEFALVICETSKRAALEMAEVIRNAVEDFLFEWEGKTFRQSISLGLALTSENITNLRDILAAANIACFSAKRSGRNKVVMHEEQSGRSNTTRNDTLWVSRIQNALINDRFVLYFQPIFPLYNTDEAYIHYEVLLRYIDDDGSHVSPDNFLPAAEQYGLANQIDLWVLTSALDFLQVNNEHTNALSCCSINLSGCSLESHQSRMAILQLIMTAEIPPEKICFEITETSAIHNLNEVMSFIGELKVHGCRFALDDFGTGFSSFGYLKNLDVDYIKIDGSFIRDIRSDRLSKAMVKAMHSIGTELGVKTIAEYVENAQIQHTLEEMNISYGQGFGLAKPMPISQLKTYYASSQNSLPPASKNSV